MKTRLIDLLAIVALSFFAADATIRLAGRVADPYRIHQILDTPIKPAPKTGEDRIYDEQLGPVGPPAGSLFDFQQKAGPTQPSSKGVKPVRKDRDKRPSAGMSHAIPHPGRTYQMAAPGAKKKAPLAQRSEQPPCKRQVTGSTPVRGSKTLHSPLSTNNSKWLPVEISVYSAHYHNGHTATGERYDHYKGLTAATTTRRGHWDLPRGSVWEVNYRGKTVVVRVNDCGSYRPRKASYWLDLSGAAWKEIAGAPSRHVAKMRRVE